MIKKYSTFRIVNESGMQNITNIINTHKEEHGNNFEIFFHQDLDGVCSALAMKKYLQDYDLVLVDSHIIQYGSAEYVIQDKQTDSLAALVDFAHSKPMFSIHTDHHTGQAGVEKGTSTHFKPSRSNAETISGVISPGDIFISTDVKSIQTVDSANFLEQGLTPDDIQNAIFSYKKDKSPERNRLLMGLVVNRLLLSLKNKRISVTSLDGKNHHINRNLMECIVLDSNPSLYSIFNNLRHYINNAVSLEWDRSARVHNAPKKLTTPEEIMRNLNKYIGTRQKYGSYGKHKDIEYDKDYKIVSQYGIGYVMDPGSYDRYVVFKNFPDAEFVCTTFPMGLIQVSCNPFKERRIKDIDMGAIAKEVLAHYKKGLDFIRVSIADIKRISESDVDKMVNRYGTDYQAVGFKFKDLEAFYKGKVYTLSNRKDRTSTLVVDLDTLEDVKECMDKPYNEWTSEDKNEMNWYKVSLWDIIEATSGGHKAITNIQSLNFMSCRKDMLKAAFKTEDYLEVMRSMAALFIKILKSKIDDSRAGKKVTYNTGGVDFKADVIAESYEYIIVSNGNENKVDKDIFLKHDFIHKRDFVIDRDNKKIIGKIKNEKPN